MPETLMSSSNILLYGRVMTDMSVSPQAAPNDEGNHFLRDVYSRTDENDNCTARLARIYGFSYAGTYYALDEPVIFLVHGPGVLAQPRPPGDAARQSVSPTDPDLSGVDAQDFTHSDTIMVWTYDKNDFSIRLDVSTGWLEDILLGAELGGDMDFPAFGGGKVGGGKVGGGKVGGGKVGGGKVGGGKVGGGKVGGGKVGGG